MQLSRADVVAEVMEFKSGRTLDCPILHQQFARGTAGQADILLVATFDRWSRETAHHPVLYKRLRAGNMQLWSTDLGKVKGGSVQNYVATNMGGLNQMFAEQMQEKLAEGRRNIVANQ